MLEFHLVEDQHPGTSYDIWGSLTEGLSCTLYII